MSVIQHRILSPRERWRLRKELDEKKRELRGEIVIPEHPQGREEGLSERRMGRYAQFLDKSVQGDTSLLKKQIAKLEKFLSNGSPDSLSSEKRVQLEKQATQDREWLKSQMCRKGLYYAKYKDPEFEKAKQACAREHAADFQAVADRYKNHMRQIDPENPDASNIERIRPD